MANTPPIRFFFFQAEDGIRDDLVTGVQTCALPISKVVGEDQADPGLAAADRLALSGLRQRSPRGHYSRQKGLARPDEREGRRDQSANHRARRRSLDA